MSSSSEQVAAKPRREVSYFGPIYIAAYPAGRDLAKPGSQASDLPPTSDKGTSTEPFDVSKYKISPRNEKKTRDKSESPKRSPKRFLKQMKIGIGEKLHRHNNNESKDNEKANDNRSDVINKLQVKPIRRIELPLPILPESFSSKAPLNRGFQEIRLNETVSVSTEELTINDSDFRRGLNGAGKCNGVNEHVPEGLRHIDSFDDTYDSVQQTHFKISSTEDNYLKNKAIEKEKTTAYHNRNRKSEFITSEGGSCDDTSEICETVNTGTEVESEDGNGLLKDRVFKNRELIAKLKRKFFESPTKGPNFSKLKTRITESTSSSTDKLKETEIKVNIDEPKSDAVGMNSGIKCEEEVKPKRHFATESRASRLRNSGKSHGRQRRLSLDGKLFRSGLDDGDTADSSFKDDAISTNYVAVVAIDFGTTQSGYAYSFLHDPGTINTMRRHSGGDPGVFNQKIPTTILLTPDGEFHSFGFDAIEFYHDLDPKESSKWMFFDRFKMMLFYETTLGMDSKLRSVSGKEIHALKIFTYSLAYFKNLILEELNDQSDYPICCDVIRWVITVPAIWRASAKQFMRQAAYEAGIVGKSSPDKLLIALEPEAASIYCRKLRLLQVLESPSRAQTTDQSRASTLSLPELSYTESSHISNDLSVGTRYLVVDCGGGTVDITVHEILPYGRLRELHRASGGPHGSTGVDAEFEKLIKKIFGEDIIHHFKRKRPAGWIELMSMFESRKRAAGPYRTSQISVSFPFSFIDFYKKSRGQSVDSAVKKYGDPEVTWTSNGMLKLTPSAMRRLFLPTIDSMKQAIGAVLNDPNTRGLSYMFLVGGFAESSMVQHEVRKDFGGLLKIIIPPGVSMTIVKGAVYFGLDPNVVTERRSCQTYGVGVLHRFDINLHPENKRISKDGIDWCTDILDVFVYVNQSVGLGDKIVRRYTPVRRDQSTTTIHIYSTEKDAVSFISDTDVIRCGTLSLSLEGSDVEQGKRREIRAEMTFGDTEIKVRATDVISGRCVEASIDFINV